MQVLDDIGTRMGEAAGLGRREEAVALRRTPRGWGQAGAELPVPAPGSRVPSPDDMKVVVQFAES